MQLKIEKVTYVEKGDWEWPVGSGTWNYNFVVKAVGIEDKRWVYVSRDKDKPKIYVGLDADFNIDEARKIKVKMGENQYEYPKIDAPKQAFNGGGGFGGGNKNQPQTPEQIKNGLVSYLGGYAKEIIIHRVNLGKEPKDIIAIYEELLDGFMKASVKHIK